MGSKLLKTLVWNEILTCGASVLVGLLTFRTYPLPDMCGRHPALAWHASSRGLLSGVKIVVGPRSRYMKANPGCLGVNGSLCPSHDYTDFLRTFSGTG